MDVPDRAKGSKLFIAAPLYAYTNSGSGLGRRLDFGVVELARGFLEGVVLRVCVNRFSSFIAICASNA